MGWVSHMEDDFERSEQDLLSFIKREEPMSKIGIIPNPLCRPEVGWGDVGQSMTAYMRVIALMDTLSQSEKVKLIASLLGLKTKGDMAVGHCLWVIGGSEYAAVFRPLGLSLSFSRKT